MNNILLVFGGNSVEKEISIITSLQIKNKYKGKYNLLLCYLNNGVFYYCADNIKVKDFLNIKNKSKFKKINFKANKNYFYVNFKKINFLSVLITAHGMNCEDGTLLSYFKTLNINVIAQNIYSAAVGQDKILSKEIAKVDSLPYVKVNKNIFFYNLKELLEKVEKLNYPIVIKPSRLGSSVGVYCVSNIDELIEKIELLLNMCEELIIERKQNNFKEYNIALLSYNHNLIFSEIEKVSNGKVLTYDDKYANNEKSMSGQQKEIPAKITSSLKDKIVKTSTKIYNNLSMSGIVRIDYLYDEDNKKLYFNEINNIPGSLALYLFKEKGIDSNEIIDMLIDEGLKNIDNEKNMITNYNKNILNETTFNNVKFNK